MPKHPSHNTTKNSLADEIDAVLSLDESDLVDEVKPFAFSPEDDSSSLENEDIPEESNNITSSVENTKDSSYVNKQGTSQSPRVSSTKQAGKYYGLTPSEVVRFWWSDATYAVDKKMAKLHRDRVNRAAAKIKKREEKFYSNCNKIAAMRNATENTKDKE